jgi:hypothetical protein
MMKNSFSQKDIGAAVIYRRFCDGATFSATITEVTPDKVKLQYFPLPPLNRNGQTIPLPVITTVMRADWGSHLTRMVSGSSFFVPAAL